MESPKYFNKKILMKELINEKINTKNLIIEPPKRNI